MNIFVDIDNTICITNEQKNYPLSKPIFVNIAKINKLYEEGHLITYWTARGASSKIDWKELTLNQLKEWGCKYHNLLIGQKPSFDMLIDDKAKRIEEL
jgi:hypothetical protein